MTKKLLTLTLGLLLAFGASAQWGSGNATVPQDSIRFWTGSGSNRAVVAVTWETDDEDFIGIAWGVQWDGSVNIGSIMDTIAAYDPRVTISGSASFITNIGYTDSEAGLDLLGEDSWWWYNWKDLNDNSWSSTGISYDILHNGDFVDWMQMGAADVMLYATDPDATDTNTTETPVEATIDADEILYWVGSGANKAILAVNWADTALAWGFRFDGSSVTVADMMQAIADNDPRFSFSGTGFVNDITFNDSTVSLAGTPGNYWGSTNNGVSDMGLPQVLADGDFEKWGDPAAGVVIDSMEYSGYWYYTYAYPMTIHPVSVPYVPYVPGPFCGGVGTEGCDAIAASSSDIVAWATGCTVERGPQNIAVEGSPLAGFGQESYAVGPVGTGTNNVVSLGDGGSATLTFAKPIVDGDGPDFAVFENAIQSVVTEGYFLELAFVEVSSDGEHFVRFPATSLTATDAQVGTYGEIDPTYINNLAGKYIAGHGTPFDLAELADSTGLDISNITHVRVVDVVGTIDPLYATYDAFGHIVNDPYPTEFTSCGFDLAGVAVLHQSAEGVTVADADAVRIYPNPATDHLTLAGAAGNEAILFDMTGRRVAGWTIVSDCQHLSTANLAAGVYMLRVGKTVNKVVIK